MRGVFTEEICDAARRHAESQAPREACGLVVNGRYEPCENAAVDPHADFLITTVRLVRALNAGLQAVVHSHIGDIRPSGYDIAQQYLLAVPWAIIEIDPDGRAGSILVFEAIP